MIGALTRPTSLLPPMFKANLSMPAIDLDDCINGDRIWKIWIRVRLFPAMKYFKPLQKKKSEAFKDQFCPKNQQKRALKWRVEY